MSKQSARQHDQPAHEIPAYGMSEAARYLKMPAATLRSWTVGRTYPRDGGRKAFFEPLIELADVDCKQLSFANLVEAHVLKALRTEHGIPVHSVRTAIGYAEKGLGVKRLLLSRRLRTHDRNLFVSEYGKLINLSRSGQYALGRVLDAHLRRVDWQMDVPLRLYPFLSTNETDSAKTIVIDPGISFGRPILVSRGVTTAIIVQRMDAGETVDDLAKDYELATEEIDAAIVYERAA
jgi:uncharacterized protein (DUF433 family)